MRRLTLIFLSILAALAGLALMRGVIGASANRTPPRQWAQATPPAVQAPNRQIEGAAEAPAISFIDNPSPTCYRARPGSGVCYVTWRYLNVTASSSQYIISMTVSLDGRLRAYNSGFFQTSMTVPGDLYGPGFRVTCGRPGEGPSPNLGRSYNFTIRARETGGLSASSNGSITCPADEPHIYLPVMRRN